uniref:DH domain-containing protein n=1 Tax=Percolomonas cosmopolitus TaxID=63605 RepID=A0A7S1KQ27_9EUKA|mmetsp:Transcript_475/g.1786  ORF Transcript_475/g.1786 Transcript_475/m.1786 type:complete len:603 (+) Transcript_475:398-2206(+)|eukprot:CAMPEP_0117445248 /NCGR_PEP_ID=MMETSP0759-20121206/5690_1 /TAXON_ID=63605 /ORGANISM="Percolomonas cosmopolitus, Strain WS" /LENGTH=602 /DNA_ID=CAMNT_0005237403 /DNA_START=350 /DNA_END=2158 /DNA_ORIENTATION=+
MTSTSHKKKRKSPRAPQNHSSPQSSVPSSTSHHPKQSISKKKQPVIANAKKYGKVSSSGYGAGIERPASASAKKHKGRSTKGGNASGNTNKKKHLVASPLQHAIIVKEGQMANNQKIPEKDKNMHHNGSAVPTATTQHQVPSSTATPPTPTSQIDTQKVLSWPLDTLQHEYISLKQKFDTILSERTQYKQKYQTVQEDYLNLGNYCKLLKKELKELEAKHNKLVQKYNDATGGRAKEKKVKAEGLKKKTRPELSERTMTTRKQTNILAELLSTEQDYVKLLRLIETHFYEPIRQEGLMSEPEQRQIFGNVQMVRQINEMFLQELEFILIKGDTPNSGAPTNTSPTPTQQFYTWKQFEQVIELISRVFVSFKLYCGYIGSYQLSIVQLNAVLKKNGTLREFLRRVESELKNTKIRSSRLHSLLVTPIQRPPRYLLLIEQLLKVTDAESHSHNELQKALSLIREICDYLNRQNGVIENSMKMLELQEQLQINHLIHPSRKFLGEARNVDKLKKNGRSAKGNGVLYIFNDLFLFCQKGSILMGKKTLEIPLIPGSSVLTFDEDGSFTVSSSSTGGASFTFLTPNDGAKIMALLKTHESLSQYRSE